MQEGDFSVLKLAIREQALGDAQERAAAAHQLVFERLVAGGKGVHAAHVSPSEKEAPLAADVHNLCKALKVGGLIPPFVGVHVAAGGVA